MGNRQFRGLRARFRNHRRRAPRNVERLQPKNPGGELETAPKVLVRVFFLGRHPPLPLRTNLRRLRHGIGRLPLDRGGNKEAFVTNGIEKDGMRNAVFFLPYLSDGADGTVSILRDNIPATVCAVGERGSAAGTASIGRTSRFSADAKWDWASGRMTCMGRELVEDVGDGGFGGRHRQRGSPDLRRLEKFEGFLWTRAASGCDEFHVRRKESRHDLWGNREYLPGDGTLIAFRRLPPSHALVELTANGMGLGFLLLEIFGIVGYGEIDSNVFLPAFGRPDFNDEVDSSEHVVGIARDHYPGVEPIGTEHLLYEASGNDLDEVFQMVVRVALKLLEQDRTFRWDAPVFRLVRAGADFFPVPVEHVHRFGRRFAFRADSGLPGFDITGQPFFSVGTLSSEERVAEGRRSAVVVRVMGRMGSGGGSSNRLEAHFRTIRELSQSTICGSVLAKSGKEKRPIRAFLRKSGVLPEIRYRPYTARIRTDAY